MKHLFYLALFSVLLVSCGGDDGGDPNTDPPVSENKPPNTPTQITPVNNALCIDNAVLLEWSTVTDPDGDAVNYELQVATNTSFTENLVTRVSITPNISMAFDKGVAYYWRVRAKDSKNAASDYSGIFSFYTEGEGDSNHLPFSPNLMAPEINSVLQDASVDLRWSASDVDNDPLTFDVYAGLNNPPTVKVAEGISEVSYTLALESSKDYYWRVVVKDNKGGEAIGQIWSFKTD